MDFYSNLIHGFLRENLIHGGNVELPGLFEKRVNMMENHVLDKSKVCICTYLVLGYKEGMGG
jgi:hypothetical protein